MIYVTDNGSNLICALKSEAHIRCVCHCINLAIQHSIQNSYVVDLLVKSSRDLVTHFKKCEIQHVLPTTLKHDCITRWNSIYEMLKSILMNFTNVESIIDDRKETFYLDNINQTILSEICSILSIFKTGSELLSSDDFPTLHLVVPFFKKFQDSCEA